MDNPHTDEYVSHMETTTSDSAITTAYATAYDARLETHFGEGYERRRAFTEGFMSGFDAGAFAERMRVVEFIADNQDLLREFAGDRTAEMLSFILREMRADNG